MTNIKDLVVWGGLYKVKHKRWEDSSLRNDQVYYQAVPVLDKDGNLWMQDTYQLNIPSMVDGSSTQGGIERIFKLHDPKVGNWVIYESRGNFYHKGNEKIEYESQLDDYELICDLHDWRPKKKYEDYRQYSSDDVLHGIHLYKEHGYSWDYGDIGVILIKKGAEPVLLNKFNAALQDTNSSLKYPDDWAMRFDDMISYHDQLVKLNIEIDPRIEVKFQNTIWLKHRLKEMKDEIHQYLEDHKYRDHYDFEDGDLTLGQIHPDMERYLEEDCYCPGEIYDRSGFSYQLFSVDNKCQLIAKSNEKVAVIARTSDSSYPQCIVFWYDDKDNPDKIIAAQRVDATENNIEICKNIVMKVPFNGKEIDEFEEGSTAKMINEILSISDAILIS